MVVLSTSQLFKPHPTTFAYTLLATVTEGNWEYSLQDGIPMEGGENR